MTIPGEIAVFGAGNIGRGLLAPLVAASDRRPVFIEADPARVRELRNAGAYRLRLVGSEGDTVRLGGFGVLHTGERDAVAGLIGRCEFAATAVGGRYLSAVASLLEPGLRERIEPLNILVCENWPRAEAVLAEALVGLGVPRARFSCVPCSVERMVRAEPDTLDLVGEAGEALYVQRTSWAGPVPGIPHALWCEDVVPFYKRKLFTNNAGHAALAYLGARRRLRYIHEALEVRSIHACVSSMLDLASEALAREYGLERPGLKAHVHRLLEYRFACREFADPIQRVARDPLRKLGPEERLVGLLKLVRKHGLPTAPVSTAIGAALGYVAPADKESRRLQQMVSEQGLPAVAAKVLGVPRTDPVFREVLAACRQSDPNAIP